MSALLVESDSLHISDPTRSRSTVHVGVTHPTPLEESAFGRLYVLTEIETPDRINQDIVAAMQDELRSTYYRSTEFSVEAAFEAALQAANRKLHEYISNGVTDWVEHFHAIIAVVKHDLVTMSAVGRVHAFLFRGNRITDISGRTGQQDEKRNPLKIFSSVLTGRLQRNDRMLLSTSSLLDFFSQEKLKRLIIEDLPSATLSKIEQALSETPSAASFGAILFAFLEDAAAPASAPTATPQLPVRAAAPQRSMEELVEKERATEQLLSPKIMPNVSSALQTALQQSRNFIRTRILGRPPRRVVARQLQSTARYAEAAPPRRRPIWRLIRRITIRLLLIILAVPRWITSMLKRRPTVRANVRELPNQATGRARSFVRWAKSLTPKQSFIMIGVVVALFVLSQTVISMSKNRQVQLKGEDITRAVQTIEDNVNRAAAALTYDDAAGAKRLVDESTALLEQLPNRKSADKSRRAELAGKIEAVRQQARRVVVPELVVVTDDGSISAASPVALTIAGTNAIIVGREDRAFVRVNLTTKEAAALEAENSTSRLVVGLDAQTAVIGNNDNTIKELNTRAGTVRDVALKFANSDRDIVSASVFQSRIYLLDRRNDSILRTIRSGSNYGTPTQWLQETTLDLDNAVSLAVDGNIYVARASGEVLRLSAGRNDDVTFEAADPALEAITHIWTSDQSDRLFILEPSRGRVITYDKTTRQVKQQYVHDDLKSAVAFTVDPAKNIVYVLTGNRLLSFSGK